MLLRRRFGRIEVEFQTRASSGVGSLEAVSLSALRVRTEQPSHHQGAVKLRLKTFGDRCIELSGAIDASEESHLSVGLDDCPEEFLAFYRGSLYGQDGAVDQSGEATRQPVSQRASRPA